MDHIAAGITDWVHPEIKAKCKAFGILSQFKFDESVLWISWRPSTGSFISRGDVTSGSIHGGAGIAYVFLLFPPPPELHLQIRPENYVWEGWNGHWSSIFFKLPSLSIIRCTMMVTCRVRCSLLVLRASGTFVIFF